MDGILVAAKPAGPTSHDVVALVRRLSGTRRVGHGGTLDPFATGVLPLFLGRATRLVEYHLGADKRYRATVCFGASSSTDDLDGDLVPASGPAPDRATVEAALSRFRGAIDQRPPAYSAIKVAGRRAYALAREGEPAALEPRRVTIHALELVAWDGADPERPIAILDVTCSAGTYVRSLARDLGVAVGSAAYLGALVRTRSGPFTLEESVSLERVRAAAAAGELGDLLLPVDRGLEGFPPVPLSETEAAAVALGQFVRPSRPLPPLPDGARYRLLAPDGSLLSIAGVRDGRLAPEKVFAAASADRGRAGAAAGQPRGSEPRGAGPSVRARRAPMRVVPGLAALTPADGRLFVVVGVFDGLHLGHAYLLEQLRVHAARLHARPAVVTFDAHPEEVLHGHAPPMLVDPAERLVRLGAAGVAVTVVQHFDAVLRMTPYDRFVAMISDRTEFAGVLMTPDAAFGHDRGGTVATLTELGLREGFEVIVVPPFELSGRQVRSSEIRERIALGDLEGAATLLGRPVAVVGERVGVSGREAGEDRTAVDSRPGPADGADGADGPELRFGLPVALPPDGRYPAIVEPPLELGHGPGPSIPMDAIVAGGRLRLASEPDALPGRRLRVSFPPPA